MDPPAPLVARAVAARRVVELAAGRRWELALALHRAGARVAVTDLDPLVLGAPSELSPFLDDLEAPDLARYEEVELLYALRLPEELQVAAARLAQRLGADLALRPLKDEWADLAPHRRRFVAWPDGWRLFPASP